MIILLYPKYKIVVQLRKLAKKQYLQQRTYIQ